MAISDQYKNLSKSKVPAGWDEQTYKNFKAANPTLEPDAENTARMNGTYKRRGVLKGAISKVVPSKPLTPGYKATLQKEAPETLIAPKHSDFSSEESYRVASQRFKQSKHWATERPKEDPFSQDLPLNKIKY